jgi:4-hydroxy-2-oxoheptanedioate aldolase
VSAGGAELMAGRLRQRLAAGEPSFGAWVSIPSPLVAEALAVAGFDYVCVDCQHGFVGLDGLWPLLQAMALTDTTPLVRVPGHDPAFIGKALDYGASGVIVPMVEDVATAAAVAQACRYSPAGNRSRGGGRAALVGGRSVTDENAEVLCFVMIETSKGVAAADAVAAVPGIDGIYIGPSDLAISLGVDPTTVLENPSHLAAIATVQAACENHGKVSAIHTAGPEHARARTAAGFAMCTITADLAVLRRSAAADLDIARA